MAFDPSHFMPLITNASQSKNHSYQALEAAKANDEDDFREQIEKARIFLMEAHRKQTDLLNLNARENKTDMSIYLIHAMDHVTNAQLVYDLIKEMAELYQAILKSRSDSV